MAEIGDLPYMENVIIDFSLLSSPSPVVANEELKKLHSAINSWSCFQLVNHGISVEYLNEVQNMAQQFFALPQEEKQKYSRTPTDLEGYGNDSVTSENVPLLWQFRVRLTIYPLEDRKLNRWPPFRQVLDEYTIKVKKLHDKIIKDMALCLNIEEDSFLKEYGEKASIVSRPQVYVPTSLVREIRASSVHADSSALTFLLQDKEIEALEVRKDGQWFKAPIIPGALFVNVGDQMEIMSNGMFKSLIHRVVPPVEKERISVPLFFGPALDKEVGPLQALITPDNPARYTKVKNYGEIFLRYHPTGILPITTVKI